MMNNKPTIIDRFSGDYEFLSNYYPATVMLDDTLYPSVEHAYVAAKSHDHAFRNKIRSGITAGEAKRLGRSVQLRSDWNKVKNDIMRELVIQKFVKHDHLRELLLKTGDAELVEGNWWGDTYWGVCDGVGHNHLGKILMDVRKWLHIGIVYK